MESPGNPLFHHQETTLHDGSGEVLFMTSVAEAAPSENATPITCSSCDSIAKVISENPSSAIEIPVSLSCDKPDSSGLCLTKLTLALTAFDETAPGWQSSNSLCIIATQMNHCLLIQVNMLC
jgi:hypothetical protein